MRNAARIAGIGQCVGYMFHTRLACQNVHPVCEFRKYYAPFQFDMELPLEVESVVTFYNAYESLYTARSEIMKKIPGN